MDQTKNPRKVKKNGRPDGAGAGLCQTQEDLSERSQLLPPPLTPKRSLITIGGEWLLGGGRPLSPLNPQHSASSASSASAYSLRSDNDKGQRSKEASKEGNREPNREISKSRLFSVMEGLDGRSTMLEADQRTAEVEMKPGKHRKTKESAYSPEEVKALKGLSFFHGFLPREDLPSLLTQPDEFLIRISEVDHDEMGEKKPRREVILSICADVTETEKEKMTKSDGKIRNLIIFKKNGKFAVEKKHSFDSIAEMLLFFSENRCKLNKRTSFTLKRPICQQSWEFSHAEVVTTKFIGQGAFGEVRSGLLHTNGKTIKVAVKVAKGDGDASKEKIKEIMSEARLMRNLNHVNVVHFYGVSVDEQPIYIILELITGGALCKYLQSRAKSERVGPAEKLSLCLGAARGIEYLHANNYMHRDLAARNCLITSEKVVKISDFGMSIVGKSFRMTTALKLPIRWLAPETISRFMFSQMTDVFSYGVLAYEIWSDGTQPWKGISNAEVKKLVSNGQRVKLSADCPESLRVLIEKEVFEGDPTKRATMKQVVAVLIKCGAKDA